MKHAIGIGVATIATGGAPRGIAFAENGKIAIVASDTGYLTFID